jgi:Fe-S-cluster containining protein
MGSICGECSTRKHETIDCCTLPFKPTAEFFLTIPDVIRIIKETKLHPKVFCRINSVSEEEYKKNADTYQHEVILNRTWLSLNGYSKCFFLGPKGCKIPNAKPMICRIHPFWYEIKDNKIHVIWDKNDHTCLCIKKSSGMNDMLTTMKQTETEVYNMVAQLESEIKEHEIIISKHKNYPEILDELFKTHSS